jgi:hypothetical protein
VISNSTLRHNVESYYPDIVGTGNVARNNCVFGAAQSNVTNGPGFTAISNLTADPHYLDRAGKDFRLAADSPCAALLAGASLPAVPDVAPNTSGQPKARDRHTGDAPVEVTVSHATLKRSRHHRGRWRLRLTGRVRGAKNARGIVQVRRGGGWQRLAVRRLHGRFRISVNPRIPALHGARVTMVRVVIKGGGKSRPVPARVRG